MLLTVRTPGRDTWEKPLKGGRSLKGKCAKPSPMRMQCQRFSPSIKRVCPENQPFMRRETQPHPWVICQVTRVCLVKVGLSVYRVVEFTITKVEVPRCIVIKARLRKFVIHFPDWNRRRTLVERVEGHGEVRNRVQRGWGNMAPPTSYTLEYGETTWCGQEGFYRNARLHFLVSETPDVGYSE